MPPHLTTLPREIRDAILELCLVVGTINPQSRGYWKPFIRSTRKPDISLLAVNKVINAEATEILYGKNVWVINWVFKDEGPRKWVSQAPKDEIWQIHHDQIRHVIISLDPRGFYPQISEFEKGGRLSIRKRLIVHAHRWQLSICRELGFQPVTIDMTGCFHHTFFTTSEAVRRCGLESLLDWVEDYGEISVGEPNPASVRSYPKITLTAWSDALRTKRRVWEELRGPLSHFVNDNWHCLERFFQPRDAKTIEKI